MLYNKIQKQYSYTCNTSSMVMVIFKSISVWQYARLWTIHAFWQTHSSHSYTTVLPGVMPTANILIFYTYAYSQQLNTWNQDYFRYFIFYKCISIPLTPFIISSTRPHMHHIQSDRTTGLNHSREITISSKTLRLFNETLCLYSVPKYQTRLENWQSHGVFTLSIRS